MDPWYFIDIDVENDEWQELNENCTMAPDGCWEVACEKNIIKYQKQNFNYMQYDNNKKELTFVNSDMKTMIVLKVQTIERKKN